LTLTIKCAGTENLPVDAITVFQGGLKKLTKSSLEKLKSRILIDGFIAPIFIWEYEGDNFILDGHQRDCRLCYPFVKTAMPF
jgi:hypothetical protein